MPATVLDNKPETITRVMKLWKCLLHNDDHNDMIHVCESLQEVFKLEKEQCIQIMLEAHQTGVALVKVEPKEHAEMHKEQMESFGLTMTIEPED